MTHEDELKEVIDTLAAFRIENKAIMEQIKNSLPLIKFPNIDISISKVIKEYAKINSEQIKAIQSTISSHSPIFDQIKEANLSISKLASFSILSGISGHASALSNLWKEQIKLLEPSAETIKASQMLFQSEFSKISELTLLAQRSIFNTSFKEIGAAINLSNALRKSFTNVQYEFTRSYSSLFKSFELETNQVISLPPAVSLLPPVEFYAGARVVRLITYTKDVESEEEKNIVEELSNENTDIVPKLLHSLEPSLLKLWQGANMALNSKNPDSVRHCLTSLRELLTHVIHALSPDNKIQEWSNSPEHYYKNKPTRRARLLYICREINFKPFDNFLNKDIDSVLECYELFQRGTHEIEFSINQKQLDAIKLRTESAIRFLIKIGLSSS